MVQIENAPALKFLRTAGHAIMAAAGTEEIALDSIRSEFGVNFNTLLLINTNNSVAVNVYLDGVKVAYLPANNGSFSFDWKDGINYTFLKLENADAAVANAANDVKITVGRTGA